MAQMTPEEAEAFVSSLPEISGARTPVSRADAARRAVLSTRGIKLRTFEVDAETVADLAQCRSMAGITNRQALRQAVALLRIHIGDGMGKDGVTAFQRLAKITGAPPGEVADFCYRYTLQELLRHKVVAID